MTAPSWVKAADTPAWFGLLENSRASPSGVVRLTPLSVSRRELVTVQAPCSRLVH
jgi:hypothetical protein